MVVKRVGKTFSNNIKFSFCPIEKHKGELWEKLQDRELDEPCEIVDITYEWSDRLALGWWREDTFKDFTWDDIHELKVKFNQGVINVPGIVLTLDHMDGEFTTFRTWTASKDNYYQDLYEGGKKLSIVTPLNPKKVA